MVSLQGDGFTNWGDFLKHARSRSDVFHQGIKAYIMERHLRLASRPSTAASDDAPRVGRPERDEGQLRKRRESEVLPGGLVERWRKTRLWWRSGS